MEHQVELLGHSVSRVSFSDHDKHVEVIIRFNVTWKSPSPYMLTSQILIMANTEYSLT